MFSTLPPALFADERPSMPFMASSVNSKSGVVLRGKCYRFSEMAAFLLSDVKQAAEMATAFLEKYPLTLNDSLLVYAYATDRKPRGGARIVSPLAAVDVREFN